jgi:hypothetical protein
MFQSVSQVYYGLPLPPQSLLVPGPEGTMTILSCLTTPTDRFGWSISWVICCWPSSAVILCFRPQGTHDHIFLCHNSDCDIRLSLYTSCWTMYLMQEKSVFTSRTQQWKPLQHFSDSNLPNFRHHITIWKLCISSTFNLNWCYISSYIK